MQSPLRDFGRRMTSHLRACKGCCDIPFCCESFVGIGTGTQSLEPEPELPFAMPAGCTGVCMKPLDSHSARHNLVNTYPFVLHDTTFATFPRLFPRHPERDW